MIDCPQGYTANPGWCPPEVFDADTGDSRKVDVILANGIDSKLKSPDGWTGKTTRWTLNAHPFDVAFFKVRM